jgi:hypothetical protein
LIIKRLYQIIENGYNLVEHIGRQKMAKAEVNLKVPRTSVQIDKLKLSQHHIKERNYHHD